MKSNYLRGALLCMLFLSLAAFAQVPQGISYQAIASNSSGTPVVNSNVGIRLSILDNSVSGTMLYEETHTKTTNAQGLFNLVIGQGTVVSGTFAGINWGTNSKFLKVEMDTAGGSNYALVGTTQLLSVPYALTAKTLAMGTGEGITFVSPNGTPYQVTMNDVGQFVTTPMTGPFPSNLYLYGTFNSYDPTTALLMAHTTNADGYYNFNGYKYLPSGTEIKFLSANMASAAVYGEGAATYVILNGSAFPTQGAGFYFINVHNYSGNPRGSLGSFKPWASLEGNPNSTITDPAYDISTNTFTYLFSAVATNLLHFYFNDSAISSGYFGDNQADGSIENGGAGIPFPGATATPKNYMVKLVINFDGSGTYTITEVP